MAQHLAAFLVRDHKAQTGCVEALRQEREDSLRCCRRCARCFSCLHPKGESVCLPFTIKMAAPHTNSIALIELIFYNHDMTR